MIRFFCLIFLAFLNLSCVPTRESLPAPETPKIIPPDYPLSKIEIGSGAIPEIDGIKVVWHPVEKASGYKIYRGSDTSGLLIFEFYYDVKVQGGEADTVFIDRNVEFYKPYYYYLTAYNRDGVESKPSDTISYILYKKPILIYPVGNTYISPDNATFRWSDPNGGGDFVIRVFDETDNRYIWLSHYRSFATENLVLFDFDGGASSPLIPGHKYTWRVDRVQFGQYAGAKSNWGVFNVK